MTSNLQRISGTRIVATPAALDSATLPADALVMRFAADEAFVTANVAADAIADPYAIVVADSSFVGTWAKNDQALDFLQRTCEWRLPAQRPAFAQGMVAGLPMKLWFAEDEVLLMVAAPYASDLLERMQGSH